MRFFSGQENRSTNFTEEEQHVIISMLPGYTGTGSRLKYVGMDAIENSDVYTAVRMISSDIASLRLEYLRDEIRENGNDLTYLINMKPNPYYTGYQFKFIMVANALLNGEAFAEIVRSESGKPLNLYHLSNSKVTYEQSADTNGKLLYSIIEEDGTMSYIQSENMIHLKFFSLDGISGISPLLSLGDDLATQKNSKKFLSNFFKNGTQSGGSLKYKGGKLSKEAREKLRDEWQAANAGGSQAHKVLVLDETMDYSPIEIDTEILKLVNTSEHSTIQVAKAFGIPRHKFGLETANMNLEEMNLDYIVNTLSPYLESFAAELNFKALPFYEDRECRYWFNTDNQRIIGAEAKNKIIHADLSSGLISLNEARRRKGEQPMDDEIMGNKHFISLNFTTLDMLEEYQMAKASTNPVPKGGDNID